jgi:hypothetical protein
MDMIEKVARAIWSLKEHDPEAIERLARHLHFTMERFDPSPDPDWSNLTNAQRELFRSCIRELLLELPRYIDAALLGE